MSYFRTIRNSARKTQLRASGNVSGSRSFSCTGLSAFSNTAVFSESTSVTPTEISKQPRRPGSQMSARSNVTRSSSDSQTYPPFAVQVDSETSKDRDQFNWSRSFALGSMPNFEWRVESGEWTGQRGHGFQISNFKFQDPSVPAFQNAESRRSIDCVCKDLSVVGA